MKTGRYSGYADPFLAAGFTSAAYMSLRATIGAGTSGGISKYGNLFVIISARQGGISGRFNFGGVRGGGGDEPNGYRRFEGA